MGQFHIICDHQLSSSAIIPAGLSKLIGKEVIIGHNSKIYCPHLSNIFRTKIGEDCVLHSHIWLGGVTIGNRCKIEAFAFLPPGITLEDDVFIGPGVKFANDMFPPSGGKHWAPTLVKQGAKIGMGALILPGVTIGENAFVAAGALVNKDIPDNKMAVGAPAKIRELPVHYL